MTINYLKKSHINKIIKNKKVIQLKSKKGYLDVGDVCALLFFACLVIGVIAFIVLAVFINHIGASKGEHTGTVTAVEHNSNLVWPSTIVYFKTDIQSTQEDKYCVNDPQVEGFLRDYAKSGKRITIYYSNPFLVWKSQCNGGESIITGMGDYE